MIRKVGISLIKMPDWLTLNTDNMILGVIMLLLLLI